jgi:hypothetical protein
MFSPLLRKPAQATSSRSARTRKRRPSLEALEGRQLMSLGVESLVNTTTRNAQFESDNASSANGTSVVVWTDTFSSTDHDIRAQVYNANGSPRGPEIAVSLSGLDEGDPAVAMDANGNFTVAWRQTQPGGDTNVVAQRFNSNGVALTGVVQVGAGTFRETDPDVAMDPAGNFAVSYTRNTNNNNPDIFAKQYASNGVLLNVVNVATTAKAETRSSIAMAPDGRFDVAYQLQFSGSDDDVLVNRYGPTGTLFGTNAVATSGEREQAPSISMDNFGNAVVAYQKFDPGFLGFGGDWDIKARRISGTTGNLVGGEINIRNTGSDEVNPSVALRRGGSGGFVVAYDRSGAVEAAELNGSNTVTAIRNAGSSRFGPAVSISGADFYLLSYTSNDAGDRNIRRRVGLL